MKPVYEGMDEGPYTDWYICGKCAGRHILEGMKFCPHCGEPLEWEP
jgi:hypothetical protein